MDENLCFVRVLHAFIQQSSHICYDLEDNHSLFLAHITHDKYRARLIRPKTANIWLEEPLRMAGAETI